MLAYATCTFAPLTKLVPVNVKVCGLLEPVTGFGLMLLIVGASSAPVPLHPGDSAQLRLSWSARPERIEVCRTLSSEELARVEEHMRQRVQCDGRFATYSLKVEVDGRRVGDAVVRGAGLRHDRSMYLLRDFDVSSGLHRVRVTFKRREHTDDDAAAFTPVISAAGDTGIFGDRAEREATEHARRARAAIPKRLMLDTVLTLAPRGVTIVTFNQERRTLELRDDARLR